MSRHTVRIDVTEESAIKGLGIGEAVEVKIAGVIHELELPRKVPKSDRFSPDDDGVRTGSLVIEINSLKVDGENEFTKMAEDEEQEN